VVGDWVRDASELFGRRPFWWSVFFFSGGLLVTYLGARYVALTQRLPASVSGEAKRASSVAKGLSLLARTLVAVAAFFLVWPSMALYDPLYRKVGKLERLKLE
jgi:hypothetical protein